MFGIFINVSRLSVPSLRRVSICSKLISLNSENFTVLMIYLNYIDFLLTKRHLTGILCASLLKHIFAVSSGTPDISYITVPGLTTAAQYSGSPFPFPILVSRGIEVTDLCGKILM